MKYLNKICGLGLIAFLIMLAAPNKSHAQEGGYVSDQEFYDELDPYGTWVDDPTYGNVWIPDAEDGFRPYASRGHWVVTDYGNTWVSDYPWGWATFHYGRWRYDDYYGWEWIPGHEWAPAWVNWRRGGGYYAWAPLTPGISINLSFGNNYRVPDSYWTCAPQAYIGRPNIYNYYVPHTRVVNIIHQTTVINNTYVYNNRTYVTGPRVTEIRKVTRENVRVYKVGNATRNTGNTTITNNTLNIYRPEIRKTADARPARVVNGNEYRKEHPTEGIANRQGGQATINRNNAARLAAVAKSNNEKLVKVNHDRPAAATRPGQPDNKRPDQPNTRPAQAGAIPTPAQGDNKRPDQNTRPGQSGVAPAVQPGARPTRQPNNAQATDQNKVRLQQEQARQEQARQHGQQQTDQARQQQLQQRQQQQEQAKQKQEQGRQAGQQQADQAKQQQLQQRQAQQEQAKQQQLQQRQAQQEQAKQQQLQQRQAQQEQAKQQQVQQRQAQQEQAKQQQLQQRQAQQEQAKQQQLQQRQAQQEQAKQQQLQQRQAQQEQAKQQQLQQRQQQQEQAKQQQAQQRQAQQQAQRQQQQKQQQEKRPAARPADQ